MKNKKFVFPIFLIVIGLFLIALTFLIIFTRRFSLTSQAKFEGKFDTELVSGLNENIDKYMEENKEFPGEDLYQNCSHEYYGRDDKYIYTWMICENFAYNKESGEIQETGGYSMPTRLEYNKDTYQITGYKQPGNGNLYTPTLNELFPKETNADSPLNNQKVEELEHQNKQKYLKKAETNFLTFNQKLSILTDKYPEFKDWEYQPSFSGKTFYYKTKDESYYFAFVTNGSGVGVIDASCFEVDKDGAIKKLSKSGINSDTLYVDPISCKGSPVIPMDSSIEK